MNIKNVAQSLSKLYWQYIVMVTFFIIFRYTMYCKYAMY